MAVQVQEVDLSAHELLELLALMELPALEVAELLEVWVAKGLQEVCRRHTSRRTLHWRAQLQSFIHSFYFISFIHSFAA